MTSNTLRQLKERLPDISEDVLALNFGESLQDAPVDTPKGSKPNKYHNVRTELNGRTYSSGREAKRAQELQLMEKAGEVYNLGYQKKFPLFGGVSYVADFVYLILTDGKLEPIVEDAKGFRNREYLNKKKQFKAKYGLEIKET